MVSKGLGRKKKKERKKKIDRNNPDTRKSRIVCYCIQMYRYSPSLMGKKKRRNSGVNSLTWLDS